MSLQNKGIQLSVILAIATYKIKSSIKNALINTFHIQMNMTGYFYDYDSQPVGTYAVHFL